MESQDLGRTLNFGQLECIVYKCSFHWLNCRPSFAFQFQNPTRTKTHTHTYGSKESENFLATQRQVFSKLCPTLLGVLLEIELDFIWQQAEQSPIHLRCKKLLGLVPSISCSSRTLFISKEKKRCNHIESLQSKNFASYPKKICVPKK